MGNGVRAGRRLSRLLLLSTTRQSAASDQPISVDSDCTGQVDRLPEWSGDHCGLPVTYATTTADRRASRRAHPRLPPGPRALGTRLWRRPDIAPTVVGRCYHPTACMLAQLSVIAVSTLPPTAWAEQLAEPAWTAAVVRPAICASHLLASQPICDPTRVRRERRRLGSNRPKSDFLDERVRVQDRHRQDR